MYAASVARLPDKVRRHVWQMCSMCQPGKTGVRPHHPRFKGWRQHRFETSHYSRNLQSQKGLLIKNVPALRMKPACATFLESKLAAGTRGWGKNCMHCCLPPHHRIEVRERRTHFHPGGRSRSLTVTIRVRRVQRESACRLLNQLTFLAIVDFAE